MPFRPRGVVLVICLLSVFAACGQDAGVPPTVVTPPIATPAPAPPPEPAPLPPPPPPEPAALDSLALVPSSIDSQGTARGTVTLTREAPVDGAVVMLTSSVVDAARTPASVTVPAGSSTAAFIAASPTVGRKMTTIISATYRDVTRTATLIVNPPALEAMFNLGVGNSQNRCWIVDSLGRLNCPFDARDSRGFPTLYHWTLQNDSKTMTRSVTTPLIDAPTGCDFLSGARLTAYNEFTIRVDLQVADGEGNKSGNATKSLIVMPFGSGKRGYCGYY